MSKYCNFYLTSFLLISSLYLFSQSNLFSQELRLRKPFVDSIDQIPNSLASRKDYFKKLLAFQKLLVNLFTYYMKIRIGDVLSPYEPLERAATEAIRMDFYTRSVDIQTVGTNMITSNTYTKEELFAYQRMIQESTEIFKELFQ